MGKLAINGGPKAAGELKVPDWPIITNEDRKAVMEVLESAQWCRLIPNSQTEVFEKTFARYHDDRHAIAVSNGTVATHTPLPNTLRLRIAILRNWDGYLLCCHRAQSLSKPCRVSTYGVSQAGDKEDNHYA